MIVVTGYSTLATDIAHSSYWYVCLQVQQDTHERRFSCGQSGQSLEVNFQDPSPYNDHRKALSPKGPLTINLRGLIAQSRLKEVSFISIVQWCLACIYTPAHYIDNIHGRNAKENVVPH